MGCLDFGHGVKMPAQLKSAAVRSARVRLVAEDETIKAQRAQAARAIGRWHVPIMVARNPAEGGFFLQRGQQRAGIGRKAQRALAVMKRVAKDNDTVWAQPLDEREQVLQRVDAVMGRQHLPAPRKGGGFFQMEIRHHQRARGRPIQRRLGQKMKRLAAQQDGGVGIQGHRIK